MVGDGGRHLLHRLPRCEGVVCGPGLRWKPLLRQADQHDASRRGQHRLQPITQLVWGRTHAAATRRSEPSHDGCDACVEQVRALAGGTVHRQTRCVQNGSMARANQQRTSELGHVQRAVGDAEDDRREDGAYRPDDPGFPANADQSLTWRNGPARSDTGVSSAFLPRKEAEDEPRRNIRCLADRTGTDHVPGRTGGPPPTIGTRRR